MARPKSTTRGTAKKKTKTPKPVAKSKRPSWIARKRHDLLTPVNGIVALVELLREDAVEANESSFAKGLERIGLSGERVISEINHLLNPHEADCSDPALLQQRLKEAVAVEVTKIRRQSRRLQKRADEHGWAEATDDLKIIHQCARDFSDCVKELQDDPSEPLLEGVRPSPDRHAAQDAGLPDSASPGQILIVDDNETNREILARRLTREGHRFDQAADGAEALRLVERNRYDLILLDLVMPVLDGGEVLKRLKGDADRANIPVLILSAFDHIDQVARCLELGADDFLPAPFEPLLLRARINACLAKKRFRDKEAAYLEEIRRQREKSEQLLLNILPGPVAEQLKGGEEHIAESFPAVTILFSDLVGFTRMAAQIEAGELVRALNEIVQAFDFLAAEHGVEKIKTIGDAYMAVAGLPNPCENHAARIADMAFGMLAALENHNASHGTSLQMRIGIHTGPVVAGIIGSSKFAYDLWGDTVNTASRIESHGVPGKIHVSDSTKSLLDGEYDFEDRGGISIKDKDTMRTWFLHEKRAQS